MTKRRAHTSPFRRIGLIGLIVVTSLISSLPCRAQLLYQISGNGALNKSYLFATNRLTDIAFLDSVPGLFKAYAASDKVITEFTMLDYEATTALRTAALLPDTVRLQDRYTGEQYDLIDQSLQLTLGMGLDKLGRMKPQYLTEMYRTEVLRKWAGYDESRSSEHFFEDVATQQGIPVYGLDEIGEAIYMMFDREPFYWQCSELLKVVEYPEREIKQERAIRDLYRRGRLLDITYVVSSPDNQSTVSFSDYKVFCARNTTWVHRLQPFLHDGHAFICLNAIYLGGENGLIAQLQSAGYRVKPVKAK